MNKTEDFCKKYLPGILEEQKQIAANMTAELSLVLSDARECWLLDPRGKRHYVADTWVGNNYNLVNPANPRIPCMKTVRSIDGGWVAFVQNDPKEIKVDPTDVFKAAGFGKDRWGDILKVTVSLPPIEVNGHLFQACRRDVWVIDPNRWFWPGGKK